MSDGSSGYECVVCLECVTKHDLSERENEGGWVCKACDKRLGPAEPSPGVAPMQQKEKVMIAKTPEEKAGALIIEIRSGEYTPLYAKKLATMFHDQAEAYSKRVPAVAPRETQAELQGGDDVLYRLLKFVWSEGYSDTSPIVAEAEAFVRARLEGGR